MTAPDGRQYECVNGRVGRKERECNIVRVALRAWGSETQKGVNEEEKGGLSKSERVEKGEVKDGVVSRQGMQGEETARNEQPSRPTRPTRTKPDGQIPKPRQRERSTSLARPMLVLVLLMPFDRIRTRKHLTAEPARQLELVLLLPIVWQESGEFAREAAAINECGLLLGVLEQVPRQIVVTVQEFVAGRTGEWIDVRAERGRLVHGWGIFTGSTPTASDGTNGRRHSPRGHWLLLLGLDHLTGTSATRSSTGSLVREAQVGRERGGIRKQARVRTRRAGACCTTGGSRSGFVLSRGLGPFYLWHNELAGEEFVRPTLTKTAAKRNLGVAQDTCGVWCTSGNRRLTEQQRVKFRLGG